MAQKRLRAKSNALKAVHQKSRTASLNWLDLPTLAQWEILRWVVRKTDGAESLKQLQFVSKLWDSILQNWRFWFPIFEDIRIQRQRLVPAGIEYLIRPVSLQHLRPMNLYITKLFSQGQRFSGHGTVIKDGSLYEGALWRGLFHGRGVLYEHKTEKSPAFRYQGRFREHHLHCAGTDHCEYLIEDGTVFHGTIEYRNRQYHCNGLFRYSSVHPRFPGECYLGDVLENDRHGTGMILMPDRSIVYATFIRNEIHGKALHIDFPSGGTKSVEYRFGVPLEVLVKLRDNLD